jgi:hypothetical protein
VRTGKRVRVTERGAKIPLEAIDPACFVELVGAIFRRAVDDLTVTDQRTSAREFLLETLPDSIWSAYLPGLQQRDLVELVNTYSTRPLTKGRGHLPWNRVMTG